MFGAAGVGLGRLCSYCNPTFNFIFRVGGIGPHLLKRKRRGARSAAGRRRQLVMIFVPVGKDIKIVNPVTKLLYHCLNLQYTYDVPKQDVQEEK